MDTVLLLITAGLCAVSSHAERHYHFVYDLKNWTDAQSYCREKYTDLATIDNMEDVNTLINMANTSKMVYSDGYNNYHLAWIGLYRGTGQGSWKWSLSNTSFYKHGETEFRQWSTGEPDNAEGNQHCTFIRADGVWKDIHCEYSYKAMCSYVRGSDVTFILITTPMTWAEAQSYCRKNYADLTSVRNITENQKVQELVPAGEKVWIGLFRDSWKWSDGSSSSFRHWRPWEPDNYGGIECCVVADFDFFGQWGDIPCGEKTAFICYSTSVGEKNKQQAATNQATTNQATTIQTKQVTKQTMAKQVFRLKFATNDSSVDLNDPAVTERILKKIKQKLRDQGLDENVKLSWRKQPDGKVFHKEEKKTKKKKKTKKDEL